VYAAPANLLAKQPEATIQQLENVKSALCEILWYLQTTSPEQATALFDYLRSNQGDDVEATLQHFTLHRQAACNVDISSDLTAGPSQRVPLPSV
jgi:hypothetical protein